MSKKSKKSQAQWIEDKIREYNFDVFKVNQLYDEYVREFNSDCTLISYRTQVKTILRQLKDESDDVIIDELVSKAKSKQKLQDTVRILRKELREQYRVLNAFEELEKQLIELLTEQGNSLKQFKIKKPSKKKTKVYGVLQLSDLHFNEIVSSADTNNNYDFTVASKRLKKFVEKAKLYFSAHGVHHVLIVGTGDFLNSDRRLDELLSQSTNRAKATLLSIHLLQQLIIDIAQDYSVTFTSVVGNESRAYEDLTFSDVSISNNYDWTIFHLLKKIFDSVNHIQFLVPADNTEQVIELGDVTLLITHGMGLSGNYEKAISQLMGKYAAKGINIDFVLTGHLHSTYTSDYFARSASLVGSNAYSDKKLNLMSKASQNIFIIEGKNIDRISVDLQDVSTTEGYGIVEELEAYNAKSADKLQDRETILTIRV